MQEKQSACSFYNYHQGGSIYNAPEKTLFTGLTRQDGAYIAGLLLFKGNKVHERIGNSDTAGNIVCWKPQVKSWEPVTIMIDAGLRATGPDVPGKGDVIIARKFSEKWWNRDRFFRIQR